MPVSGGCYLGTALSSRCQISTISVRRAKSEDVGYLVAQLKEFSVFFGTRRPLFPTEEFASVSMLGFIENHLVLIAERGGEQIGFIAGMITPHAFNPEIKVLLEMFWWVNELHRGSRAGLLLLEEFTAWGRANVDWILMGLEAKSPVNEKVLTKRGFKLHERSFLLEVN